MDLKLKLSNIVKQIIFKCLTMRSLGDIDK
jgi:hypothetical protein